MHADVAYGGYFTLASNLGRDAEEWTRSKLVYIATGALTSRAHVLINSYLT